MSKVIDFPYTKGMLSFGCNDPINDDEFVVLFFLSPKHMFFLSLEEIFINDAISFRLKDDRIYKNGERIYE